ncbi:conserved hypothetical protein [Sphingobacterium sp. PM2-P1-29]|nr:conserved hypothetical protein [Sphingobacterium sp. PM2-P1-29]
MKISKSLAVKIYRILVDNWDESLNRITENEILKVLEKIWEWSIKEKDGDFFDIRRDILENYLASGKWSSDYLFQEKLGVLAKKEGFSEFVNILLNPILFSTQDSLERVVSEVKYLLGETGLSIRITDFAVNDFPIYKLFKPGDEASIPPDIERNKIPFYIGLEQQNLTGKNEHFLLVPNKSWNDYSVVSIFALKYFNGNKLIDLESTKIIHRSEMETWQVIPQKFFELDGNFCSLSSDEDFYLRLKREFGIAKTVSILYALKDAAYFVDIHEDFSETYNFKNSLIRSDEGERMIRQVRPILHGHNLDELYNFSYNFRPAYAKEPIKLTFDYSDKEPIPDRIFAVIGKNGTGKTQLLTSLPESLSKADPEIFFKKTPNFSKVIAISYSAFDNFKPPKNTAQFNYVYCGLRNSDGQELSKRSVTLGFYRNWEKIIKHDRVRKWQSVLKTFIEIDIVDELIYRNDNGMYEVIHERYQKTRDKLSSGQSILLSIITQVIANIRFDSLLLYDEPETHLHPNAITALMNTIYELVNEFESYCLIATHSPLVIRELFSKNVFIMEKHGNVPSLKRISIESFGENLGVLTEEVFGDRSTDKKYKSIILNLVRQGYNYDEIIDLLQFDEVPLSLNVKIYIRNLIGE